jgi:hypothetical protein
MANVTHDPLADAVTRYRRAVDGIETAKEAAARMVAQARQRADREREALAAAIVKAARNGRRQVEIVRVTGYTRERVRQICRAAGVE